jgi:hypothetical protein
MDDAVHVEEHGHFQWESPLENLETCISARIILNWILRSMK